MTTKEMVEAIENILQSDLNLSHGTNQALTQAIEMIERVDMEKIHKIIFNYLLGKCQPTVSLMNEIANQKIDSEILQGGIIDTATSLSMIEAMENITKTKFHIISKEISEILINYLEGKE